jgi:hypothetical protein
MIPQYVRTPIAAKLVGLSETDLRRLVAIGAVPRHGAKHRWHGIADLERLRGSPITAVDLAFATEIHTRRLRSYAKQNVKRRAHARA